MLPGRRGKTDLEVEHAGLGGRGKVLAGGDLVEGWRRGLVSCLSGFRGSLSAWLGRTVDLEEVVVARLGRQLLGVDDGRLEGFALGHFVFWVVGLEDRLVSER